MARTAVVAGTATAVARTVAAGQQQKAAAQQAEAAAQQQTQQDLAAMQQQLEAMQAQQAQAAIVEATPGAAGDDVLAQITQLAQLNASGVLTDTQFAEAARSRLLAS